MPKATFNFPAGFLWGSAAAAACVEGNPPANDWSEWEQQPGRVLDGSSSAQACEWWSGRWREDFDRAQETNQKILRFSMDWARVQPEPERWDEPALDRYREMLLGLKQRGMTPLLSLHHSSNPRWFAEMGGWENEQSAEYYAEYARRVAEALKAHNALWLTFSAPNAYILKAYRAGTFPPGKQDIASAGRALVNMARAHAAAYEAVHALQADAQVGFTHLWPSAGGRADADRNAFPLAFQSGQLEFGGFKQALPQLKGTLDFLGIDYFPLGAGSAPKALKQTKRKAPAPSASEPASESARAVENAQGLREAVNWGWKFELPMYISANGCDDARDDFRCQYLAAQVHALWHMVNFNAPVRGYLHWSLTDHFAWEQGWGAKYGLWALDPQTQQRTRRQSADFYAEICRTGSLSSEMVEKYCPEVFEQIFPV